jgi:hypothetical protein
MWGHLRWRQSTRSRIRSVRVGEARVATGALMTSPASAYFLYARRARLTTASSPGLPAGSLTDDRVDDSDGNDYES